MTDAESPLHAGEPPSSIIELAEERSRARAERRWERADELRAAIEAAGWRVEDAGTAVRLSPAQPPDLVVGGVHHHGSVETVPSDLNEPASLRATLAVLASPETGSPDSLLASLAAVDAVDTEVVVVAPQGVPVQGAHDRLVRTITPFGAGDALQAALRRSRGQLVVVMAAGVVAQGDILSPLEAALIDPEVAIAGADGVLSTDVRRFRPAPHGDVIALRSGCYAFRRDEAAALGPIDGRLQGSDGVAIWLSLALRDRGPDRVPRRALAVELPVTWPVPVDDPELGAAASRTARRDGHRIADRFAARAWLASPADDIERVPQDRAHGHDEDDDADEGKDAGQA